MILFAAPSGVRSAARPVKEERMFLTVPEAAAARHTTKFSVYRWIKSGLRARRVGRDFVIEKSDLEKFAPRAVGNPNFKSSSRPSRSSRLRGKK
jgi:excisionase family DNA binding protein